MINLPDGLFDFQKDCSDYLIKTVCNPESKQTIIVKAPTGAGKTVILIDFIDKFLNQVSKNVAFIWLCPGKGNLEEQSQKKMMQFLPHRTTMNLNDALLRGFEAQSTTFINWELITKRGNKAISDTEKRNLFDCIAKAHRENIRFVIIIDEEHCNNTRSANNIINAFAAKNIVRVSATTSKNSRSEYYVIDELRVIDSGLITKALYINKDIAHDGEYSHEYSYLIEKADEMRKQIATAYSEQSNATERIRPLVIIQFPSSSDRLITDVEQKLADMGYTYQNRMVAKWMSEAKGKINKINVVGIEKNSATPVFLLMKQAISTGWDCPRAKILVKLRENMDEDFEVQTIGRIRRMPEAKHYDNELLDCCYLYTFDEKYKESVKATMSDAFETRRVFLKGKCMTFTLQKELKNDNFSQLGDREIYKIMHKYFSEKYKLTDDYNTNKCYLEAYGYNFDEKIKGRILEGKFVKMSSIANADANYFKTISYKFDKFRSYGWDLSNFADTISTIIGTSTQTVRTILSRLFKDSLIQLNPKEYPIFIVNNRELLENDFRLAVASLSELPETLEPTTSTFNIPGQALYRYSTNEKDVHELSTNAYDNYSTDMIVEGIRSKPERLFENYCETHNSNIEWVYKNGDTGKEYFSIVYTNAIRKQKLFYPDYIVKKKNGEVWIIETKGGVSFGKSKNIDIQAENKFNALKRYIEGKNIKWGFIRDENDKLYINQTEYTEDMSGDNWIPIGKIFC